MPARPRLAYALLALFVVSPLLANNAEVESRMQRDLAFLASDECEGRGIGTKGLDRAAEYVAGQFAKIGLKPGVGGSYFQPFTVTSNSELDGPGTLTLRGPLGQTIRLRPGTDFQVLGFSGPGSVSAPLVFAGYGATAKDIGYDDYQGLDVKGKIVVLLRHVPRWGNNNVPFDGKRKDEHAALETKQGLAEANGAAGVILVNDASELPGGDKLIPFQRTARAISTHTAPYVQVRREVIDDVVRSGLGESLRDVERRIDRELKPHSAPLAGWTATLDVKVKRNTVAVKNIIGVLEGSGPLAGQTVVVGAHYDHLGYGGAGSGSRLKDKNNPKMLIHHGADDNASGTTALIELARRFAAHPDRQGRRLVFIAFTAEESGLIGSRHYAKEPVYPLADTAAMFNLDMVGRLRADPKTKKDKLLIEGSGTAKTFDGLLDKLNPGFQLSKKPGGNGPSDHDSFYNKKIPVIFFWTGYHDDYHLPTDTADKINLAGMSRVVDYAEKVVTQLATDPERPQYVEIASKFVSGGARGPRLGIMPDYEENVEGVLVGGVSKGGPAAKAGLKTGDRIVEIAGKTIGNLNAYMAVMGQQRPGQALSVTVIRAGQKMRLKVVPE
jgi:hypothetical protein